MERVKKKVSKKIWILTVFALFVAISMSFVSWLIYAVFSQSYREIKQQYYGIVSRQIVEDIENSIRNGKEIERYYGMDKVLNDMLDLISTDGIPINTAITDVNGGVLYSSYDENEKRSEFNALLKNENVLYNLDFSNTSDTTFRVADAGEYEVMIQPIFDRSKTQIGAMSLFYEVADIEKELAAQKQKSDMVTMYCIGGVVLLLVAYFIILPRSVCVSESDEEMDSTEAYKKKERENRFLFLVPVLAIMAGLLVQCAISYNEYQKRYKDVMFEGAQGISEYIGEIISNLNAKGVEYERMNGLPDYLADKVSDSPLLWNVSVVNVYADTSDILTRSSEYNVSLKIDSVDEKLNTHINVEISKEYIDEKMMSMLLVFVVTFAVALIMIFELLKLPDAIFTRMSHAFRESKTVQAGAVSPMLRLGAFIVYTGMYVGTPFSSVLITQWNKSLFGLPVTFLASIPMTAELLATMLCSLFCLPLYKKMNLKLLFAISTVICAAANFLCFTASSPEELIIYRFLSGIGFAGIKYSLNAFVSHGSLTSENTTNNLAELNAGLLGGITCGGTLGATIASSINVHTSYLISGIFVLACLAAVFVLAPWKLFRENSVETKTESKSKFGVLSLVVKPSFLRYTLMVAIPMNFGLMFVVAFFPGFVGALGLPNVTTSYGYLLNGLVGIYLGPVLLKALSGKIGKTACVVISLGMAAAATFILNISAPLVAVLVCVAILGLFDGFGTPATSDYYVNMPAVKEVGVNQGLSVLNVIGSTVQTFSPVLYSLILTGGTAATNVLGIVYAVAAGLFLVTLKVGAERKQKSHS